MKIYLKSVKSSRQACLSDYVHLLYYKCHKTNLNCGGSHIDSPDWIKKRNNKSHQYKI